MIHLQNRNLIASQYREAGAAFSLIEIVLAVGIIAICLLAILGLLPTGLRTHRDAREEAQATSALAMVATATESLTFTSRSTGNPTWEFPAYFSTDATKLNVWVTQSAWERAFFIDEGGLIIPASDNTTTRRQTLYVKVYPPQIEGQPVRIYAAVAWPYKASDTTATTAATMTGREGFLDTLVAFTPKSSF